MLSTEVQETLDAALAAQQAATDALDATRAAQSGVADAVGTAILAVQRADATVAQAREAVAAVTPAPTTTARFFAAASPWNTPNDPAWLADPKSDVMIANLAADFARVGKGLLVNGTDGYPSYAIPIYTATADTPKVPVSPAPRNWWKGFPAVPIPPNATPSVGTDKHLTIEDDEYLWEFWEMQKDANGRWSAGSGSRMPKRGNGWSDRVDGLASRAYGGSSTAGSILKAEMQAGVIPHCLAVAYEFVLGPAFAKGQVPGGPVCIGTHSDNYRDAQHTQEGSIPEGARLRLRNDADIDALAAGKKDAKIVLAALKDYGAYMVDHAGAPTIYAEALTDGSKWGALLTSRCVINVPATAFEVLRLPPLTAMA